MAARILIVDDHPLMRDGLLDLMAGESDLEVCGQADCAATALAAVATLQPDVVVLDLTLGSDDGIALLATLHAQNLSLKILVLSMHDECLFAERILAMGARGYLMKEAASEVFLFALRTVIAGGRYVKPEFAARLFVQGPHSNRPQFPESPLTARERDVLRLVARGLGTQDIAKQLLMNVKTVDTHRRNMRAKLGLATAADLVRYGMLWESGSTEPPTDV
jgi:DNA-binding NarL/FixJ family response regulator